MLRGVVTASEASAIIAATERASLAVGGYTTRRHVNYPTVDLPVSQVYAHGEDASIEGVVERAAGLAISALRSRCSAADDLALIDGFVIKYSPQQQAALSAHEDDGRCSATVALSRPQKSGVVWPSGSKNDLCRPDCRGETCATWLLQGHSLEELETHWGCECSLCAPADPQSTDAADFEGGGTVFLRLANVTFLPALGDAVVHGAHVRHRAAEVTRGTRYVLAFFFDSQLCHEAEDNLGTFLTSLVVIGILPFLVYIAIFADFEDQEEGRKKTT